MLSPDRIPDSRAARHRAADYDIVRRAIAYISEHWRDQPEIETIAQPPASRRPSCTTCSAAGPG